jgi:hypothetical protein
MMSVLADNLIDLLCRIFSLIAWFSVAASITDPRPLKSASKVFPLMRLSAAYFRFCAQRFFFYETI